MNFELFDYQQPHADHLVTTFLKKLVVKDGSDAGTGKTPVAATVLARVGAKPVIVCPKVVIPTWEKWLQAAGVEPLGIINYEKLVRGNSGFLTRKLVKNRWQFKWTTALTKDPNTMILWDEDHRLKGMETQNALMCRTAHQQKIPQYFAGATAFSSPIEMRAVAHALGLFAWAKHNKWCELNGCYFDRLEGWKWGGQREALEHIHSLLYPNFGSRIRIADLGDRFQKCTVTADAYACPGAKKVAKMYDDIMAQLHAIQDADGEGATGFYSALTALLRERQEIETLKTGIFHELATDALEAGYSVVIFVNFRATLEILEKSLAKWEPTLIHGNQKDREEQRLRFQENRTKLALVTMQAGGVGIDLDDQTGVHPRVALLSPSFNAVDLKQALGRTNRASSKSPAVQKLVYIANTVEEKVCNSVRKKLQNIELLNDGDLLAPLF